MGLLLLGYFPKVNYHCYLISFYFDKFIQFFAGMFRVCNVHITVVNVFEV